MENKKRVCCFIDGFNLFHALDAIHPNRGNHLKWLDLRKLANAFIQNSKEILTDVFYFSAYPTWRPESYHTHRLYVDALNAVEVKCILGHFKEKQKYCNACKTQWTAHEEKASDVNIAIYLLHHAHLNNFDKAFVVTADSDLAPAIQLVLDTYPEKEITILTPPARYNITRELRGEFNTMKIKQAHLENSLLPERLVSAEGKIIVVPDKYKANLKAYQ